jgi:hypothetical protein
MQRISFGNTWTLSKKLLNLPKFFLNIYLYMELPRPPPVDPAPVAINIENFTVDSQMDEERRRSSDVPHPRSSLRTPADTVTPALLRLQKEKEVTSRKVFGERQKDARKADKESEDGMKKSLMYKISGYIDRFPFLTQKGIPKPSSRSSVPELLEILDIIRLEMCTQNSLRNLNQYADYVFAILEGTWGDGSRMHFLPPSLRLNLTNIGNYYRKGIFNEEIYPLLMEIDLEYPWIGRQSLPMRALQTATGIMFKVHMMNTNPRARQLFNMEEAPPVEMSEDEKNILS